jgi:phenylacetate-CoA ligase
MPFIRYKTEAIAIYTHEKCKCGRNYEILKKIEGRQTERVITKSGAKVALTAIIFSQHFQAFKKIERMQLVQKHIGEVTVRVIEKAPLNELDKQEIISKIRNATKDELEVDIQLVHNIELTGSGKHKFLIQNLDV